MKKSSIWLENINNDRIQKLDKNLDVDILIIGGGITGLSTAYHLKDSNLKVCLVEKNEIGCGVTARTTGKLTYLQETIYTKLTKLYSFDQAKLYFESQKEAIKIVEDIISKNHIDCNYERVFSYLFTEEEKKVKKIQKEKEILEKFGINVKEESRLPNDRYIKYGISVNGTAVFHPLKYLLGLKKILENKINIYEHTKIINIEKKDKFYICKTTSCSIKTKKVVFALHYPYFLTPFWMPLKCHLEKSYISAYQVDQNYHFSAINTSIPTISIRYHEDKENIYELFLNGSHNIAFKNNEEEQFKNLKKESKINPDYVWSNKDIITNDCLPYIGELSDSNLLIGTGYNTWGMTNGSLAGKIISDIILNKENSYVKLFCPNRGFNISKILNFPLDISSTMKSLVGTKLVKNKSWYSDDIKFETRAGKKVAIYIDENKKEHVVYQKCPHLKCNLIFNKEEKTWDCPCHGSRFDIDGHCIEGPSNYDIMFKK